VLYLQPLRKNTLPQYAGVPLRCAVAIVAIKAENAQVAAIVAAAQRHRNDVVNGQARLAASAHLAPRSLHSELGAQSLPRSVVAARLPARSVEAILLG